MVSLSRPTLKMMLSYVIFSSPLSLMPSLFSLPRPASSTPTWNPASATRKPFQSWCKCRPMTGRLWLTSPRSQSLVATLSLREPTLRPSKQCNNCWRFGHVNPRCKNPTVCPLCAGSHTKAEHRCPNPTCPKGGNLKPVLNCYIASPARCPTALRITQLATGTARPVLYPPP